MTQNLGKEGSDPSSRSKSTLMASQRNSFKSQESINNDEDTTTTTTTKTTHEHKLSRHSTELLKNSKKSSSHNSLNNNVDLQKKKEKKKSSNLNSSYHSNSSLNNNQQKSENITNLWQLCKIEKEKEKKDPNKVELNDIGIESVLFFVGTSGGGKSSLISNIFDKNNSNVVSGTTILEYTYRHNNRNKGINTVKDTIHMWELANGITFKDFISIPINEHNINNAVFIVVLDLTKPNDIISEYLECIKVMNNRVDSILKSLEKRGSRRPKALSVYSWKKYGLNHPDKESIHPTIIPSIIIGTKYDKFKNLESENRKLICKMLRYLAHTNGSSLIFYNQNDESLTQKCKQMIFHYIYRSQSPECITDYNKPITVMAGSDSLQDIGLPPTSNVSTHPQNLSLSDWTSLYYKYFPKNETKNNFNVDLSKFPELIIDNLRVEKDDEYEKYCQKYEKNGQGGLLGSSNDSKMIGNSYSRSRASGLATY